MSETINFALNKIFPSEFCAHFNFDPLKEERLYAYGIFSTFFTFMTPTTVSTRLRMYVFVCDRGKDTNICARIFTSLSLLSIEICWTTAASSYTFVGSGTFSKL